MEQTEVPNKASLLTDLLAGYSYYYFLALNPKKYTHLFHQWGVERGQVLSPPGNFADLYQLWPASAETNLDDFLESGNLVRKSKTSPFRFDVGDALCYYTRGVLEGYLQQSSSQIKSVKEVDCVANGGKHCQFVASTAPASLEPPELAADDWQSIKKQMAEEIFRVSTQQGEDYPDFKLSPEAFVKLPEIADRISKSALKLLAQDFGSYLGQAVKEPEFKSYLNLSLYITSDLGWQCTRYRQLQGQGLMIFFEHRDDLDQKENTLWLSGLCKGILEEFTNTEWNVTPLAPTGGQLHFRCRNL